MTLAALYTKLIAGVVFPLQEHMKRHSTLNVRRQLEKSQWWTSEKLRHYQINRLRMLLAYAAEKVPYYRNLFIDLGIDPSGVETIDQMKYLPFLTKDIIRSSLEVMKAEDANSLVQSNTGGSSGEPLVFFLGRERISHDVAAKWRATRWWDVDIGDTEIVFWGSPIELASQDHFRALRDKVFRSYLLPAFDMSDSNLVKFIDRICKIKPTMLFGYPSAFSFIARYAESKGKVLNNLGIKVAFVTSECLYEDQRKIIERVFGCRVANGYGGRDSGFIAHECPEHGMHITSEDIIVEIVDDKGCQLPPGEAGEIVVTNLATKDFPFIRYRTGDIGVLENRSCQCGRGLPLIKEIQGRTTDFVVAMDGTVMHGLALIYILRELPGIKKFKITQEDHRHTCVDIIPTDLFQKENISKIKSGFKDRLGDEVDIAVKMVKQIPAEKSGKYRYVVSKVDADWRIGNL